MQQHLHDRVSRPPIPRHRHHRHHPFEQQVSSTAGVERCGSNSMPPVSVLIVPSSHTGTTSPTISLGAHPHPSFLTIASSFYHYHHRHHCTVTAAGSSTTTRVTTPPLSALGARGRSTRRAQLKHRTRGVLTSRWVPDAQSVCVRSTSSSVSFNPRGLTPKEAASAATSVPFARRPSSTASGTTPTEPHSCNRVSRR